MIEKNILFPTIPGWWKRDLKNILDECRIGRGLLKFTKHFL